MKISLGYSPCPNDTFIFDALAHGKIDLEGIDFDIRLADVEALNQQALAGKVDVTKLSFHAFAHLQHQYALLSAGSALGRNCGPLLIARQPLATSAIANARVAIPGDYTTANFLLRLAFPEIRDKKTMVFSAIEQAVLDGEVDAGLIIHENRFTYAQRGLCKIADLGEWWESTTGYPIPLGGIVVNRNLPVAVQQKIDRIVARSVAYALQQPMEAAPYVRMHAQEMDEDVMYAHINLYVNDFTKDLGDEGRSAVQFMLQKASEQGITPPGTLPIFV